MSLPDVANILRLPGRLCISPTDLSQSYPHGGTALGTFGKPKLRPIDPPFAITAEEMGGAPWEFIEGGSRWALDVELREVDADAFAAMFLFYAAGARGGPTFKIVGTTAAQRAGMPLGAALGVVLVFSPDAADDHPFVIFRRAVPAVQETAALALAGNADMGIAARWYATFDSQWRQVDFGRRRDLTL